MIAADRTYDAARAALYALAPRGIVLGLDPVRRALAHFGDPQRRIPTVHVAGTNGKGSVCAFLDAMLRADGRVAALYTSPHLHSFAERFRVNGLAAAHEVVARCAWSVLDAVSAGAIPSLTFFEATTVIAWLVFEAAHVDVVVLEVGLGGRLDATNVCLPAVTAISRIALDHQALLGHSLAAIAGEKAGIVKAGVPCVVGPALAAGESRDVVARVANAAGAPLVDAAPLERAMPSVADVGRGPLDSLCVAVRGVRNGVPVRLGLAGVHQLENASTAVAVARQFGVSARGIDTGLANARWPGRLESIDNVLLDAAHNPDGAHALAVALDGLRGEGKALALVFGASRDKQWREMLDVLCVRVPRERRFVAATAMGRAESVEALAAHADATACGSVAEAVRRARACVGPQDVVCVCGSIFVVAEARASLLGLASDPPIGL